MYCIYRIYVLYKDNYVIIHTYACVSIYAPPLNQNSLLVWQEYHEMKTEKVCYVILQIVGTNDIDTSKMRNQFWRYQRIHLFQYTTFLYYSLLYFIASFLDFSQYSLRFFSILKGIKKSKEISIVCRKASTIHRENTQEKKQRTNAKNKAKVTNL